MRNFSKALADSRAAPKPYALDTDIAKIVGCLLLKLCVPLVVGIDGVGLTDSIDLACILENSYWFPCLVSQGSHRIH